MAKQGILLESGNNEMELLEFYLTDQSFGVNVAKVRQLVPYHENKITKIPGTHPHILGTVLWQDIPINLIDLNAALDREVKDIESQKRIILVSEFNQTINGFLVDGINRIHRISWDQIETTNQFLGQYHVPVSGTAHVEDHDIQLIDFEQIIVEIDPKHGLTEITREQPDSTKKIDDIKIVLAEDSATIQAVVVSTLKQAGYLNVSVYDNGLSAYNQIELLKKEAEMEEKPLSDYLDLVITDIEMPQLDGLTLCKRIKSSTTGLPVILFSSLVNEQMARKGESCGADGNVSKADAAGLIELIDKLLLK